MSRYIHYRDLKYIFHIWRVSRKYVFQLYFDMLSAIISPLVYRPRPTSCLTNASWISLFIISCIFHDPVFFVPVDGISLCLCPGIAPVDPGCNRSWLSCFIINARAMVMAVWFLPVLAIPIVCNVSSHSYHMIVQEFPALLTWQTLGIHYHRLLCYPLPTIVWWQPYRHRL